MQKKLILLLFCSLISAATIAQTEPTSNDTVYNGLGGIRNDWYIDLQLGGDVLFNQDVKGYEATNGVRFNTSITAGKWIMPYFGFRLQLKSMWWKGTASATHATQWGFDISQLSPLSDGSVEYDIFYINPHLDFTLSLMSCFKGGWAVSQNWDIIPFLGIGYLHAFEASGVPAADCLTGHFGLQGKYRINDNWDVNLELATAFMPEFYIQSAGPAKQADLAFTVGATYNIGGHKFSMRDKKAAAASTAAPTPASYRYAAKSDTVYVYNNTETIIERAAPVSNGTVMASSARSKTFDQPFQIALIDFLIGSDKPKMNYETQYYNVAAFIAAYPEATLRLDAYCDAATGTTEYNDELAQKRAETVRNILVNEYGVDANKIILNPLGSREQVYEKTSLNRIVRITVLPK